MLYSFGKKHFLNSLMLHFFETYQRYILCSPNTLKMTNRTKSLTYS